MDYLPHQIKKSNDLLKLLDDKGFAYLVGQPRSGKTLTAIRVAELAKEKHILIVAPRSAIKGWEEATNGDSNGTVKITKNYTISTFDMVGKIVNNTSVMFSQGIDYRKKYLIIIDESHNIGSFPKRGKRSVLLDTLCKNDKRHLHLSGTPMVESISQIYHQVNIGTYRPFKSINFYDWFRKVGYSYTKNIGGVDRKQYDKICKDQKKLLIKVIKSFCVFMTQDDAGIESERKAIDKVHYVELSSPTKKLYNKIISDKVAYNVPTTDGNEIDLIADSIPKSNSILHNIECGIALITDIKFVLNESRTDGKEVVTKNYYNLPNSEKIDYIKENFDLTKKVGIMSAFPQEREKLRELLPSNVEIFSANGHAEGVDLSHLDTFIIISSLYSGVKHIQRRERIVNINSKKDSFEVHHIVCKNSISEAVYKSVSKKLDFNVKLYRPSSIL